MIVESKVLNWASPFRASVNLRRIDVINSSLGSCRAVFEYQRVKPVTVTGANHCKQYSQIYCNLGNFSKPVAPIILPKLPTFQAMFVKVWKSFIFLVKSFLGNFFWTFGNFLLVTLIVSAHEQLISLFKGNVNTFHPKNKRLLNYILMSATRIRWFWTETNLPRRRSQNNSLLSFGAGSGILNFWQHFECHWILNWTENWHKCCNKSGAPSLSELTKPAMLPFPTLWLVVSWETSMPMTIKPSNGGLEDHWHRTNKNLKHFLVKNYGQNTEEDKILHI